MAERDACESWFTSHTRPWPVQEYLVWEFLRGVRPDLSGTEERGKDGSTDGDDANRSAPTLSFPLVRGVRRHYAEDGVVPLFPFSPAPVLQEELAYLRRVINLLNSANPDGGRLILDVGCGAGRDAITLAYAFPDHRVIALDNLPRALDRVSQFAQREGRDNVLPFRCVLKETGTLTAAVGSALESIKAKGQGDVNDSHAAAGNKRKRYGVKQGSNVSLILMSRFLNRKVLYHDAVTLLRPGGYILVHHFHMVCAKPKQPQHKLKDGELAKEFTSRGLEVVRDDVFVAPDDGRQLSMFVARKPESHRPLLNFK